MKTPALIIALAAALAFPAAVGAQGKKPRTMEAIATVTHVDTKARTVSARTAKGELTASVSPGTDLEKIQVGERYKLTYQEAVAISVEPGAQAAAGATKEEVKGEGAGKGTKTARASGVVEAIDTANQHITVRTLDGQSQEIHVGDLPAAKSLKPGEAVTVVYEQPIAARMVSTPQPVSSPTPAQ